MKILIVAATKSEVQPLINSMDEVSDENELFFEGKFKKLQIDFLITGIGMVATAYYVGKVLNETYDGAFNIGICGSYNRNFEIGTVVNIYEDTFSEIGAEDDEKFLSLDDLKLNGITKITNYKLQISNPVIGLLPKVTGITVNTTHGNEDSIKKVFDRYSPYVESMEGAAFMFVCEQENIPYVQLRAVSNYVEKRNRENWKIPSAIENLNKKVIEILNSLFCNLPIN
ncbi:MAG: futalosine hydrolase [Bacteroidetes bacterium]|nr:futalosine hydrolase [Bacteroidota bacterium]